MGLSVAFTLRCDGCLVDGDNIVVDFQCEVFGGCALQQANQLIMEWLFATEDCPAHVELSEDGKKVWKNKNTSVFDQLVGDTEFSGGVHVWVAEVLADTDGFAMTAGVTTLRKHGEGIQMQGFTGWQRVNGKYGHSWRCKAFLQGVFAGRDWNVYPWNRNDILLFVLDFNKGALTMTNSTTGWSDTIHGITGRVRPCFGFASRGRGVRLLPSCRKW